MSGCVYICCPGTSLSLLKWTTEAYLKPSLTMELFYKNRSQLKAVKYFRKKPASQIFYWVLDAPLGKSRVHKIAVSKIIGGHP